MLAFTFTITKKTDGFAALVKRFRQELNGARAKAGILGEQAAQVHPGSEGLTNAQLGALHEFGAPLAKIPPRPWLSTAARQHRDEWVRKLGIGLRAVMEGRAPPRQVMTALALNMATDVRAFVLGSPGVQPPDSAATLERKRRKAARGNGGDPRTLVDTGEMIMRALTGAAELPGDRGAH